MEHVILRGETPKFGDGYGDGDGSGYGDGFSYGLGFGSGSGYGSGYGDGDGSGLGLGFGDGYGYGFGDGSGYVLGEGDNSTAYWLSTIKYFSPKWAEGQQKRLSECESSGLTIAFWWSSKDGMPANGGSEMDVAAPGVVHLSTGPLYLCSPGTLHATFIPPKWKGERLWVVAMHGEIISDGSDKIGALKREILGECL